MDKYDEVRAEAEKMKREAYLERFGFLGKKIIPEKIQIEKNSTLNAFRKHNN